MKHCPKTNFNTWNDGKITTNLCPCILWHPSLASFIRFAFISLCKSSYTELDSFIYLFQLWLMGRYAVPISIIPANVTGWGNLQNKLSWCGTMNKNLFLSSAFKWKLPFYIQIRVWQVIITIRSPITTPNMVFLVRCWYKYSFTFKLVVYYSIDKHLCYFRRTSSVFDTSRKSCRYP